jgi:hypothetical protein
VTPAKAAALFAAGYFFGAKAGRERYAQIVEAAASASRRLEELSSRGAAGRQEDGAGRPRAGA